MQKVLELKSKPKAENSNAVCLKYAGLISHFNSARD
jgi:hypothetical protein